MLGPAEAAQVHAERCHEICAKEGIGDFDLAFAYEALDRTHAVAGDAAKSRTFVDLGRQAADQIEDADNKAYYPGELAGVQEMLDELTARSTCRRGPSAPRTGPGLPSTSVGCTSDCR